MRIILLFLISFFVLACDSDSSKSSRPNSILGPIKPGEFSITAATQGNSSVILNWSTSKDATSYIVKYGTVSGVYTQIASTDATSPFEVGWLTNGVEYFFQITAVNSNGNTESNSEVSKVAIFLDEFNDTTMNYFWQLGTNPMSYSFIHDLDATTPVSFDGNEVIFGEPGVDSKGQTLETLQDCDITDAWVSTEMSAPPVDDGLRKREGGLWIINSDGDGWEIYKSNGSLTSGTYLSNGSGDPSSVAFNAVAHRHLRIRHETSDDSINFEASPDGMTWSTIRTMSRGSIPINNIHFMLYFYGENNGYGPSGIPGVKFNNIKSSAPCQPIPS